MEMHQIRYFLAVARTLNFTRAAESCHVAQPSLTRAIKQLEEELGADLFRRERNFTHLTEFGQRMLPLIERCYDSANSAKQLAASLRTGAVQPLSIAVSLSINVMLVLGFLVELTRAFQGLELRFLRGTAAEVSELLKRGDVEVAVAGPLEAAWERLDQWPLFSERLEAAVSVMHPLAAKTEIGAGQLAKERLITRTFCELAPILLEKLKEQGVEAGRTHVISTEPDLIALLEANLGVSLLPESTTSSERIKRLPLIDLELTRTVSCYGVAGRQRSAPAATLIKMLRAANWPDVIAGQSARSVMQPATV